MRYFDTFAGVGGFGLGVRTAVPGAECVGSSENDAFAASVLHARHPDVKNHGDISKIKWGEVPDFDLLTGGVPCQAWSVAGNRGGFDDPRGGMWAEFARALNAKKPRWFIAENVKGLLSHDKGRSFEAIKQMLAKAGDGYYIHHGVLDARDFGVPQMRQRVFIVGFNVLSDSDLFRFPKPTRPGTVISDILEQDVEAKYFLKPETARKILSRLKRPEELFERLGIGPVAVQDVLRGNKVQNGAGYKNDGGAFTMTTQGEQGVMIKINQRREARIGDVAGALPASQPTSQAQFVVQQHHNETRVSDAARPLTAGSDSDRQQYVLGAKDQVSYALDANYHKGPSSGAQGGRGSANKGKRTVIISMRGLDGVNMPEPEESGQVPALRSASGGSTRPLILRNVNQRHGGQTMADDVAPTLKSSDGGGLTRAAVISPARGKFSGKVSDAAPTMTGGRWDCNHLLALYDAGEITLRRLTPLECERLQGWPDGWTSEGNAFGARGIGHSIDRISDTQRYRMTGNGVASPVVAAIVREIVRASV